MALTVFCRLLCLSARFGIHCVLFWCAGGPRRADMEGKDRRTAPDLARTRPRRGMCHVSPGTGIADIFYTTGHAGWHSAPSGQTGT
eukprot:7009173-Prymnesium_polylepis.1